MEDDHELLIRIDERLRMVHDALPGLVTRREFAPVRLIAYGLVGAISAIIVGVMVFLLVNH